VAPAGHGVSFYTKKFKHEGYIFVIIFTLSLG
jgi:hypothetical protein